MKGRFIESVFVWVLILITILRHRVEHWLRLLLVRMMIMHHLLWVRWGWHHLTLVMRGRIRWWIMAKVIRVVWWNAWRWILIHHAWERRVRIRIERIIVHWGSGKPSHYKRRVPLIHHILLMIPHVMRWISTHTHIHTHTHAHAHPHTLCRVKEVELAELGVYSRAFFFIVIGLFLIFTLLWDFFFFFAKLFRIFLRISLQRLNFILIFDFLLWALSFTIFLVLCPLLRLPLCFLRDNIQNSLIKINSFFRWDPYLITVPARCIIGELSIVWFHLQREVTCQGGGSLNLWWTSTAHFLYSGLLICWMVVIKAKFVMSCWVRAWMIGHHAPVERRIGHGWNLGHHKMILMRAWISARHPKEISERALRHPETTHIVELRVLTWTPRIISIHIRIRVTLGYHLLILMVIVLWNESSLKQIILSYHAWVTSK